MFYNLVRIVFVIISSLFMFRFASSKLMALPNVVKSFEIFSQSIPLNAKFFMYFTGVVELLIALVLLVSLFIKNVTLKKKLQIAGYGVLLCTMIASILIEQYVRPAPVPFLMTIALVLTTICVSELSLLLNCKKCVDDKK